VLRRGVTMEPLLPRLCGNGWCYTMLESGMATGRPGSLGQAEQQRAGPSTFGIEMVGEAHAALAVASLPRLGLGSLRAQRNCERAMKLMPSMPLLRTRSTLHFGLGA